MTPFLKAVAQDLYRRFGDNLSRTVVVFPGKRAGLFLSRYLYECAGHSLWSPTYITIDQLFGQLSSLSIETPIRQVCMLHNIVCNLSHSNETLDDFYYWGELMLSDFDDIDKNMVDADKLFVNLTDIKEIEHHFDFLTTEHKEILQRFFKNFNADTGHSELKRQFIELWKVMKDIYQELRTTLQSKGLAYEGMQYRDAIENFDIAKLTQEHYVFVGFNVLNKVEQQLFAHLKESGKALFYWDYDKYYYDNQRHEAGTFIRENILQYGNALNEQELYDNLAKLPEITYISANTDNAQARYLHTWTEQHLTSKEEETAIVLCDEDIVQPVLHALPMDRVKNVNVTMGFKLAQTPAYTLAAAILNLHTAGFLPEQSSYMLENVIALLTHPYIIGLYPEARTIHKELAVQKRIIVPEEKLHEYGTIGEIFRHPADNITLLNILGNVIDQASRLFTYNQDTCDHSTQLNEEALFRVHLIIENFKSMLEDGTLNIRQQTLCRLMQRMMTQTSIPFHGEPAIGLQVMGVLETRNLDFRNIILLSTNEGKLPKGGNETSFIPHNLREVFEMTTIKRRDAVYAYYFYRMIQRAEHVTIVYNNGTDGINKQEPSRFLMQLQVEFPGKLIPLVLQSTSQPSQRKGTSIAQSDYTRRKLQEHFYFPAESKQGYKLSPSAINDYLECKLRFYLKHIEGLTPPEEMLSEVDTAHFGSIFHKAAELAYDKLTERNNIIHKEDLKALSTNKLLMEQLIDEAFREEFFHTPKEETLSYNGTQFIIRHVISNYLNNLLRMDSKRAPFQYVKSEKKVRQPITIQSHGIALPIMLGGTVDRIDAKEGVTRIIDYKTGGSQKTVKTIDELFNTEKARDGYVFQALYYAYLLRNEYKQIAPSLLFIRNTADEDFEPNIIINGTPLTNFAPYCEEFATLLMQTIDEIFNSDVPYTPATYKDACKYCKLTSLCQR